MFVDLGQILFIDARSAAQYAAGHLPGAVNTDWRDVLMRRDEIPTDRTVVLYCDTGLLSSKAHMALRVAGREHVKVMLGGYLSWQAHQR